MTAQSSIFVILISAIFVDNFIFSKFLGICPFLGVSKKIDTALGMGMAVTFVMSIASLMTYLSYEYLLKPYKLEYLKTITFILIIACLVQLVEMVIQKLSPTLNQALGIYLPLITTNCAVLGVTVLNVQIEFNLINSVLYGFFAACGFTLAIVLFAGIRERLELSDIPQWLKGFPIALISAGLISIAFLGFSGMRV